MWRFALVLTLATCDGTPENCGAWLQWGGDSAHAGATCAAALPMARQLGSLKFDPFVELEQADADGDLLVHYQVPLIAGDDIYIEAKQGSYTPCDPPLPPDLPRPICHFYRWNSQIWSVVHLRWEGKFLVQKWVFQTDWKPEPYYGFEPMFQPAIVGDLLYVPAAAGALTVLDRHSGQFLRRVEPVALGPDTYVASPVAADAGGNVYYTTLTLDHDDPWGLDAHGFLVKVTPKGAIQKVPFESLAVGAPAATDMCRTVFNRKDNPLPWPPPPNPDGTPATPPYAPCGTQRPGINAAPAIGADGTIFVVSTAHLNSRYSYVIAVKPDLTPKWATSLRGYLNDGCGVLIPTDGDDMDNRFHCRPGAAMGVEPATNDRPAARVVDDSSSSPVALPDGGVLYGSYSNYNGSRGHLLKLDAAGHLAGSYDFGWDTTPAVARHDGTYSILLKDNHYGTDADGVDLGPFFIVRLDKNLAVEWKFLSTNTMSCTRVGADLVCTSDHPHGFEWCINAPAVDRDGTVYANSEDGWLYAIDKKGNLAQKLFLDMSVAAAYTPLAIDGHGLIYTLNNGRFSVVGP